MPEDPGPEHGRAGSEHDPPEHDDQEQPEHDDASADEVPTDDIVEEESEDSFPASDAPSSWARPADDDRP